MITTLENDETVEEVAKSIQTFVFKNPIIVDKDFYYYCRTYTS